MQIKHMMCQSNRSKEQKPFHGQSTVKEVFQSTVLRDTTKLDHRMLSIV